MPNHASSLIDVLIVGTGPAGLGAAFHLIENQPNLKILMVDKEKICSGGLLNDCKQNYTYPIGFSTEYWTKDDADKCLAIVEKHLNPQFKEKENVNIYQQRAQKVGVELVDIKQSHVGTDKSKYLINALTEKLLNLGVDIKQELEVMDIDKVNGQLQVKLKKKEDLFSIQCRNLIISPGRKGFSFLQTLMDKFSIPYVDNIVDIGIRVETKIDNYAIVKDYYDPKFYFPKKVRTFCSNSGCALVTREKYHDFSLVNGHALSNEKTANGLANFAMLKTIGLKNPVRSGQQMAIFLARLANEIGGGKPLMQRVGDFKAGKRSEEETFNNDLYDFRPTLNACPGDLGLAVPSKIMRDIWASLKLLDTIVPGILHPSTILYYPEIKMYANNPQFIDRYFQVKENIYMIGDGAGTSRGITGAWASGIRAATGILLNSVEKKPVH